MSFKQPESSILFIKTLAVSVYIFNEIGVVRVVHFCNRRREVKKRMEDVG